MLRTVNATRYVTALREGGSLPGIVEADDDGMYVLKFRGAGQGPRALVAELIVGEIARALELPVPELVLANVDAALGRNEPDAEIRALLRSSAGLNIGLDYLPGSLAWDPAAPPPPDALFSSLVVWLDAFVVNIDRTARNTNMLRWHGRPWLIDHGAAIYFHHAGDDFAGRAADPFARVREHVLLPWATALDEADAAAHRLLDEPRLAAIMNAIPGEWLAGEAPDHASARAAYARHFNERLAGSAIFVEEARRARSERV